VSEEDAGPSLAKMGGGRLECKVEVRPECCVFSGNKPPFLAVVLFLSFLCSYCKVRMCDAAAGPKAGTGSAWSERESRCFCRVQIEGVGEVRMETVCSDDAEGEAEEEEEEEEESVKDGNGDLETLTKRLVARGEEKIRTQRKKRERASFPSLSSVLSVLCPPSTSTSFAASLLFGGARRCGYDLLLIVEIGCE
jgi:hypothetical protein